MTPTPEDINRIVNGGDGFDPTVDQVEKMARFELMVYSSERQEIHRQKMSAIRDVIRYLIVAGVIMMLIDAVKQFPL